MISAVIFDFDGLLADTECLHCQAYQQAFLGVGIELSEKDYADLWIRAGLGVADYLRQRGLSHDVAELRRHKAEVYRALVAASVCAMPGALDLLNALHGQIKLALATSGYRDDVEPALRQLGPRTYFEAVSTAENVSRLKPHPDIFLHAANQLGVPPRECLVLEDAEKGVLAARAAGMAVIAVPTRETRDNDFSRATLVVRSLEEVTLALIQKI